MIDFLLKALIVWSILFCLGLAGVIVLFTGLNLMLLPLGL